MAESPVSLSGLSLWLSDEDICSEPLPLPPAPSRKPTKSLNHFISSGCLLRNGDTSCTSSDLETTSWLNNTKHRRKLSYTSLFFRAFLTLSKNANSLRVPCL